MKKSFKKMTRRDLIKTAGLATGAGEMVTAGGAAVVCASALAGMAEAEASEAAPTDLRKERRSSPAMSAPSKSCWNAEYSVRALSFVVPMCCYQRRM